jgi:hypothetical protein
MHWIQGKKSLEDGQPIIRVKVVAVHDDGRAEIEGHDLKLTLWYHDPDHLRQAQCREGIGHRILGARNHAVTRSLSVPQPTLSPRNYMVVAEYSALVHRLST